MQKTVLTGLAVTGLALLLLSRPNCNRGCRTVAEHLLTHGLDELLGGLL
jgi:hypothetical protein